MFTEAHLISFGNYLLKTRAPQYQGGVTHADRLNWQEEEGANTLLLPAAHQHGESVWLCLWSTEIAAEVLNTHFFGEEGKVKYDLILIGDNGEKTRAYNMDSAFVSKFSRSGKSKIAT